MSRFFARDSLVQLSRRRLLQSGGGIGLVALGSLMRATSADAHEASSARCDFPPTARRVIVLTMAGGPSHLDLFDPKPTLQKHHQQTIDGSLIDGERFAFLQPPMKLLGSPYKFARSGESGAEISELLPNIASCVDDLAIVRSMHTDSFNHDPAQLVLNTGSDQPGRPAAGAWLSYGLGTESADLPAFVVMVTGTGEPLGSHIWSSGFLPTSHQGVHCRSGGESVLFLRDPAWMSRNVRRKSLAALTRLNEFEYARSADPEIESRIRAFELAFQMQSSIPEVTDLGGETAATFDLYGAKPDEPSFARNCLLARRMAERGVRFVQLFHRGWDHHGTPEGGGIDVHLPQRCREVDRATAGLLRDLKQRDMLDSTLVVWTGEFGRTPIREQTQKTRFAGRDHHPRAFTSLLAGGGIRPGAMWGATDEIGYHVAENPVHINDLHATMLHCLGVDHTKLTYRHLGRDYRLTDVSGEVVKDILR